MAFSIEEMKSTLSKYNGFHRSSHFYVQVTCPLLGNDPTIADLAYLCEATNLPGIHLDSVPVRSMGYGLQESRPTDYAVQQVRCDFFLDNQNASLDLFTKWMANIMNFGIDVRSATGGTTNLNYYEFAYPKEYEGTVNIFVLDGDGNLTNTYTLYNAFPITIGDISVAWEMNDQLSKFPVTFAYKTWSSDVVKKTYNQPAREVGQKVQMPVTVDMGNIYNSTSNQPPAPAGYIDQAKNFISNFFK